MTFERRNFLRAGTAGLAAGMLNPQLMFVQASDAAASDEFLGGTGSLRLEGKLKGGILKLEAHDFLEGKDRALITHAKFISTNLSTNLYGAMFSYSYDSSVFALLRDDAHSTMLVLSDTDDAKIGRLVVWNDLDTPDSFRVDKSKAVFADDLKDSILDGKGNALDLAGKRKRLAFTSEDLETVFRNNVALQKFRRGQKVTHHPRGDQSLIEWICRLLSVVPGSLFGLTWLP